MTAIPVTKIEYDRWQQQLTHGPMFTGPGGQISYLKRIKFLAAYDICKKVAPAAREAGISYPTAYRIVKTKREAGGV